MMYQNQCFAVLRLSHDFIERLQCIMGSHIHSTDFWVVREFGRFPWAAHAFAIFRVIPCGWYWFPEAFDELQNPSWSGIHSSVGSTGFRSKGM